MKMPFLLTLGCLCVNIALSQKAPIKFGDIPLDQLKMTRYEKDSTADAVILADYGESSLDYNQHTGFELNFERTRRIKILTKEGMKWADFSIALYHNDGSDDEKLSGLKAVTYNLENGKVVESKVKGESIFKEKQDANWDAMKVTWPNVKVGSVLEITYKINSDFLFNFKNWQFQTTIPVVWSEYRARIPEYFYYNKYMQGYISLAISEQSQMPKSITITSSERSDGTGFGATRTTFQTDKIDFQENQFRWTAKDIPAFIAEPYMTTYLDFISEMKFEIASVKFPNAPVKNYMGTWDDINKTFAESSEFGLQVTSNGFLKKITEEIVVKAVNPEEKIAAINNYIKQNIVWDETNGKYIGKSLKKVLEDKKGSAAEINLLFASMLEKVDVNVSPVLLSTRDHGFLRESVPVSSQFNYVICLAKISDKSILLDATEKLLPVGVLPERCLNGSGFVVSKSGYEWVKLQSPGQSKTVVKVTGELTSAGEIKGELQIDRSGYHALTTRKEYFEKGEQGYVKEFQKTQQWEISKSEIQNAKEIQQPFKENHDVIISNHATAAGEVLYLNPFVVQGELSNPFKSEKREYPVDFGSPIQQIYIARIVIPEGFTVEELPKSRIIALPAAAAKYSYSSSQIGNVINLTSNLQINKSLFVPEEYPNLREFYSQMIAKQAEQIVLKKK